MLFSDKGELLMIQCKLKYLIVLETKIYMFPTSTQNIQDTTYNTSIHDLSLKEFAQFRRSIQTPFELLSNSNVTNTIDGCEQFYNVNKYTSMLIFL